MVSNDSFKDFWYTKINQIKIWYDEFYILIHILVIIAVTKSKSKIYIIDF